MNKIKPTLFTSLSPALLNLYDISSATVVIIDVLRATSTIATALYNGARAVIPVDSVSRCIEIGKQIHGITAGERDGKVAEGLIHGNSPFEYPRDFIEGKTLVLTTTNGTRLLQMALDKGAKEIITGSFPNLSAVCDHLAETIYKKAGKDLFGFMKKNEASHYHRLMGFGLEKDIRYCLTADEANVLPIYDNGTLVVKKNQDHITEKTNL